MCAATREEAEWHASSLKLARLQLARNQPGSGIVSPEEAARHVFTPEEEAFLAHSGMRATTGDPDDVATELEQLAGRYASEELGIVTICFDFGARLRSYELLAQRCLAKS
jgi:alkanesulfonate monooxygenase SsuD/methylene tetrahydromethanopterin reductase-like flavin-dependent oxidoreductase (luciferase family)